MKWDPFVIRVLEKLAFNFVEKLGYIEMFLKL